MPWILRGMCVEREYLLLCQLLGMRLADLHHVPHIPTINVWDAAVCRMLIKPAHPRFCAVRRDECCVSHTQARPLYGAPDSATIKDNLNTICNRNHFTYWWTVNLWQKHLCEYISLYRRHEYLLMLFYIFKRVFVGMKVYVMLVESCWV